MRWSQLKKLIENILDPDLDLEIFCSAYRGEGGLQIGRYWITLNKEVIFDEPRKISKQLKDNLSNDTASAITKLLREYIDTPKEEILSKDFPEDRWKLIEIIRAADRRVGRRRLEEIYSVSDLAEVKKIIDLRIGVKKRRES